MIVHIPAVLLFVAETRALRWTLRLGHARHGNSCSAAETRSLKRRKTNWASAENVVQSCIRKTAPCEPGLLHDKQQHVHSVRSLEARLASGGAQHALKSRTRHTTHIITIISITIPTLLIVVITINGMSKI